MPDDRLNDIDLDETMEIEIEDAAPAAAPQQRTDAGKTPEASRAETRTKVPSLAPDTAAPLWSDDDPGETVHAGDVLGDEPADDNDEADAGDDDASDTGDAAAAADKPEAKPDPKAKDPKAKDAKPKDDTSDPAADDWRAPIANRLKKQLEARLKNTVTAAQYAAELKKGTERINATLNRYKTREDWDSAAWNAQQKIRSGELAPKALRPDATPAEKAAWRKANGIPEKPDAYEVPKVPGHDWQEHDAPVLNEFKGVFHKAGLSQAQVNEVLGAYATTLQKAYKQRDATFQQLDREDTVNLEETLRNDPDIGNAEYRPTLTLVKRLLKDREYVSDSAAQKLLRARDAQGHLIMNDPGVVKMLRQVAIDRYGGADSEERRVATVTRLQSRKAEIEQLMKTNIDEYYQKGLDVEYGQILEQESGARSSRRR